jgi:hypothetical protein
MPGYRSATSSRIESLGAAQLDETHRPGEAGSEDHAVGGPSCGLDLRAHRGDDGALAMIGSRSTTTSPAPP